MIRAHRRRHLRAFAILAVVLPAMLVAALAARRTAPVVASAPTALMDATLDTWVALDSAEAEVLEVPIRIRLLTPTVTGTPNRLGVELEPTRAIGRPDILVYWSATSVEANEVLPGEALLIGTIGGARPRRFELPQAALRTRGGGSLVLYSAAHREVLGTLPMPPARAGVTPPP